MGKGQRIIAVEIVDNPVVRGFIQLRNRVRAVVPVTAHQDQGPGGDPADAGNAFRGDPVPGGDEGAIRDLVEQLKGNPVRIGKTFRQALPQGVKALLIRRG